MPALLHSALRSLRAHPGFNSLVILLLALGLGANTAIFSVVHAVLLQPLPYPAPGDLVLVRKIPHDPAAQVPGDGDLMPDNEFLSWLEAEPKSFRELAGYRSNDATLQRGDGAIRVPSAEVTGGFFPMLGVSPWRGRLFATADLKPGAAPVTVLSYTAWQARFNGAESVLGAIVQLDDTAYTVIGVLPPAFAFSDPVQFWRPLALVPNAPGQLRIRMIRVFGRLLPGTPAAVARRELDALATAFWQNLSGGFAGPAPGRGEPRAAGAPAGGEHRPGPGGPGFRLPFADASASLVPLQEQLAKQSRATLWLLLGAVGFVLLIACANLANLQLARAAGRRRDAAVRAALGASPARLAAELLAENLLLALAGGALGLLLAWGSTRLLSQWLADYLPHLNPIGLNPAVAGFAALLAVVTGLGFGLAPAWQAGRTDLLATLKEGNHQSTPGARGRQALVALEVALALVLAANTGLLAKSIYQLYAQELGYRTRDVLTANLLLPRRYGSPAQQRDFATRWRATLAALPGVKTAALTDFPPLSPYNTVVMAGHGRGRDATGAAPPPVMSIASATPEYFSAAGIALRSGRFFTAADAGGAPRVAVVNEAFVKQYYPQGLTLGTPLEAPQPEGAAPPAIIGIAADIRPRGFDSTAQPLAYFPLDQQPRGRLSAVLRFEGDAAALGRAVTVATHRLDADLAPDSPSTLAEQIARQTAPRRVTLLLTGTFAATAILLAELGIFGVMTYTVTQRTREIGVRMALGADPAAILRWMLRYGGAAVAAGIGAGLGLTLAVTRLLAAVLSGVADLDPTVLALAAAVLALTGLLACLVPAWRATRVDPMTALRNE